MPYVYLALSIVAEVIATSSLKASEGFTKLWPSVVVVIGYGVAFHFLALTLKTIPIGVAYAIWARRRVDRRHRWLGDLRAEAGCPRQ